MPQARAIPGHRAARRRRSPHLAYTHGSYLSRQRRDSGTSQPLFRIG